MHNPKTKMPKCKPNFFISKGHHLIEIMKNGESPQSNKFMKVNPLFFAFAFVLLASFASAAGNVDVSPSGYVKIEGNSEKVVIDNISFSGTSVGGGLCPAPYFPCPPGDCPQGCGGPPVDCTNTCCEMCESGPCQVDGGDPGGGDCDAGGCPPSCGGPSQPPCPECGDDSEPACPTCGQDGQPPCPGQCGQEGQPECPVCGQPGQPACQPTCGVPGQPACPTCGQPFQPPCPQCGQPGQDPCLGSCGDVGQPPCPICGQPGQPVCPSCGQPGQPVCPTCGQPGQPACPTCGQPGQPACPTCGQPGQPPCPLCGEAGQPDCPFCGDGQVNAQFEECGEPGLTCSTGYSCYNCRCISRGLCGNDIPGDPLPPPNPPDNEQCGEPGLNTCTTGQHCENCRCIENTCDPATDDPNHCMTCTLTRLNSPNNKNDPAQFRLTALSTAGQTVTLNLNYGDGDIVTENLGTLTSTFSNNYTHTYPQIDYQNGIFTATAELVDEIGYTRICSVGLDFCDNAESTCRPGPSCEAGETVDPSDICSMGGTTCCIPSNSVLCNGSPNNQISTITWTATNTGGEAFTWAFPLNEDGNITSSNSSPVSVIYSTGNQKTARVTIDSGPHAGEYDDCSAPLSNTKCIRAVVSTDDEYVKDPNLEITLHLAFQRTDASISGGTYSIYITQAGGQTVLVALGQSIDFDAGSLVKTKQYTIPAIVAGKLDRGIYTITVTPSQACRGGIGSASFSIVDARKTAAPEIPGAFALIVAFGVLSIIAMAGAGRKKAKK